MTQNIEHQKLYWEQEKNRRCPEHPVVKAFASPKIEYIGNYVGLSKNKILDIGCGNGFFTYYFSKITYTVGLDYSRYMLSINPCDKLVQSSALLLPFKDNTFDIVFCSNLLHHLEDPRIVIEEMRRVSQGFVVLSEPNRNNPFMALFSVIVPEERGALKFSLCYLKGLITRCGLKIIASCSMGSVVPNKTPKSLLSLFKIVDRKTPFGFYNIIISHK